MAPPLPLLRPLQATRWASGLIIGVATAASESLTLGVTPEPPLSLSFTAGALRPDLVHVLAESYLTTGSWDATRAQVVSSNALQARSPKSSARMELELRKRLKWLTEAQLRLAAFGNVEERTAISWLAALKSSAFIYAFASEVLRSKLAALDPILRSSDYEAFFENQCVRYPRILTLTSSSRVKVRSVLLKMCSEVGIGTRFGRELHIRRPSVPLAVVAAITADSPQWLSGFLIPDSEIPLI